MDLRQRELVKQLVKLGLEKVQAPKEFVTFGTGYDQAEELLNDLKNHPHQFVLACVMDRQISASRAWRIPYVVGRGAGGFSLKDYLDFGLEGTKAIFRSENLHRYNDIMANCFYSGAKRIQDVYGGDASKIWAEAPNSATSIRLFLEFEGVGIKIATMAVNLLVREFKIPFGDLSSIDVSPDSQVRKLLESYGLLRKDAKDQEIIYLAREIYPQYPGVIDYAAWRMGQELPKVRK